MRLLLTILFCLFTSQAQATMMNFQQFKKLSSHQQTEILKLYKEFVGNQNSLELEAVSFSFKWNLIQEAYAASRYNCFYAGWPSTKSISNGKALCSSPARANADYKALSAGCSSNQIMCNPVLFGAGHCVSTATKALRNSAFNQCENKFKSSGGDLAALAQSLASSENSSQAEELFELVNDSCADNNSGMCAKLKARVAEIKQAGNSETSTSNVPTETEDSTTESSNEVAAEAVTTTNTDTEITSEPVETSTGPAATTISPNPTQANTGESVTIAANPNPNSFSPATNTAVESSSPAPGDCSDVNLIKKENSPFNKVPVLDQSGSGMCYAYSAAQLVNYELIDSGKAQEQVVHPAWAAVVYGRNSSDEGIRGGVTSVAIQALASNNCDYKLAKAAIGAWASLVGVPENRILAFIDDYGTTLRNDLMRGKPNDMTTRRQAFEQAAGMNRGGNCTLARWMKIFESVDEQAKNSMEVADRLMATQCQSDKLSSLGLPPLQSLLAGEDQVIQKRLDDTLERGKPISMSFCSNSIDFPNKGHPDRTVAQQQQPYNRREIKVSEEQCGPHVALVVGRKKINNSCHYLYRNSRGNKWFSENRHMTCVCKDSKGNVIENCKANTHARGYSVEACWVPATKLVPNVWSVDHY